jgi:hypothetical protein
MRRLALCCCAVALVSCRTSKDQVPEDAVADDTEEHTMEAAPIALSEFAGRWSVRLMSEDGDSTLGTYEMVATSDTAGWEVRFPNRPPVPVRVLGVEADSVITEVGPYESLLRKGVPVTSQGVQWLENDTMVSRITAHYQTKDPDSVLSLRSEATRAR